MESPAAVESEYDQAGDERQKTYNNWYATSRKGGYSEIEEEDSSSQLFEIKGGVAGAGAVPSSIREEAAVEGISLFSYDISGAGGGDKGNHAVVDDDDDEFVYVTVGKSDECNVDAVVWTLNHSVNNPPTTVVYLIHVFPQLRHIPTPLGKVPVSQVNAEQKEKFLNQERSKRRNFLQKFLHMCTASKVKVETILIESDMEAKAILDLIPILNIRKLIIGTTKANLRKMKSRRGSGGIADQIHQNAPDFCDVKIICQGKQVVVGDDDDHSYHNQNNQKHKQEKKQKQKQKQKQTIDHESPPSSSPVSPPRATADHSSHSPKPTSQQQASQDDDSFTCSNCFIKLKIIA